MRLFLLSIALFFSLRDIAFGQDSTEIVYGTWKINNMVFVSPPKKTELDEIWKDCQHKKLVIDSNKIIFKASKCFLCKTVSGFRITRGFSLTYDDAVASENYSDKNERFSFR